MRRTLLGLLAALSSACSSGDSDATSDDAAPVDVVVTDGATDATETETSGATVDAKGDAGVDASLDVDGGDVRDATDGGPYVPPAGTSCEHAFFSSYFDRDNGTKLRALRDATFTFIVEQVKALQGCGAKITLGGMLSLMIYEGGGAKVAFFNDKCAENSYDKSPACWTNPKARYSYQYGLAPVHTSNFHPCVGAPYTAKMRGYLEKAILAAGFSPTAAAIASVTSDVHTFCPTATPTIVDYYIVSTHDVFAVPTNTTGNDLPNAGKYPFFTPRVVIELFFDEISAGGCATLTSDGQAITVFGGADTSYAKPTKQATILALWRDYKAANCP
jgi:hypothetical protein